MKLKMLLSVLSTVIFFLPFVAHAEQQYEELVDYFVLENAPSTQGNTITVEEAFWYGCPYCNALQPYMKIWLRNIPEDVSLQLLPVPGAGDANSWTKHAKLYYALELLSKNDAAQLHKIHDAIFHAIHVDKKSMLQPAQIAKVTSAFGITEKQLTRAMDSFPVRLKVNQARKLAREYEISGTPALIIDSKYVITATSAKGNARMIRILDFLIEKIRKDKR